VIAVALSPILIAFASQENTESKRKGVFGTEAPVSSTTLRLLSQAAAHPCSGVAAGPVSRGTMNHVCINGGSAGAALFSRQRKKISSHHYISCLIPAQ